jgi:hypothetical protein
VYLACYVIELRLAPTTLLEHQAIGVWQQPPQFAVVPFEVADETRNDADPRFVLKAQTGPALWVRLPGEANGLDILA